LRQVKGIQHNDEASAVIAEADAPIRKLLNQAKPWLLGGLIPAFAAAFVRARIESLAKLSVDMRTRLASQISVVSLTVIADSIPMWSYYAGGHTGFCVEYDLKSLGPEDCRVRALYPVLYKATWPDATDTTLGKVVQAEGKTSNATILSVLTKSPEWQHEQEWRMFFPTVPESQSSFPVPMRPQAIYLGVKMPADHKTLVINWAKDNHVSVFEMQLHRTKYQLVPRLVK